MITGIKHILFDLGGVLINLDYNRTEQAFVNLGIKNFGNIFSQLKQTTLFDDLETGKIPTSTFFEELRKFSGTQLSDDQITFAWNEMLLDFPIRRLEILQQLRPHYDLVLISNTNEIHEIAFNRILQQAHGVSLASFFDRYYLSHKIGMRKPDPAVFQRILNECGFEAQHTLFIDDNAQNIAVAQSVGIQSIHLTNSMTIENDIFKPHSVSI
ncbi:MAG: HAD family phosphatase [Bacteroidetes bacterium]|nr:HAD family phosphatase [Bacteroidota bacterium]MBS1741149.1 HAD family phosphatase [Bacteroidota bacterium]